ncbi:MAG: hypothetical protein WBI17_07430 [Clostridiaceae bacterium]
MRKSRSHNDFLDHKKENVHFYISSLQVLSDIKSTAEWALNDTKSKADYSEMGCFKDTVQTTPSQLLEQRF